MYLVDYSDAFDNGVEVSIEEVTQQVSDAIVAKGIMRDYNHVWFIGHSMGGVIIKRMLVKWSGADRERYLRHTLGVSLLGTPSNGAPLANVASSYLFARLVRQWLGFNAGLVRDLKTIASTNTYLGALENDWASFVESRNQSHREFPKIQCGYETKAQYRLFGFSFEIVPSIYASTQCDGERKPFNKTHFELAKPTSREDPVHGWLYESVRTSFLRMQTEGETIDDGREPGVLFRKVRLINTGNERRDAYGEPLVDESIEVDADNIAILKGLKLRRDRYFGATWADVLEAVAEDNSCIRVSVPDRKRRAIRLSTVGAKTCPQRSDFGPSLACSLSDC